MLSSRAVTVLCGRATSQYTLITIRASEVNVKMMIIMNIGQFPPVLNPDAENLLDQEHARKLQHDSDRDHGVTSRIV